MVDVNKGANIAGGRARVAPSNRHSSSNGSFQNQLGAQT
jgi:hypothetical protein